MCRLLFQNCRLQYVYISITLKLGIGSITTLIHILDNSYISAITNSVPLNLLGFLVIRLLAMSGLTCSFVLFCFSLVIISILTNHCAVTDQYQLAHSWYFEYVKQYIMQPQKEGQTSIFVVICLLNNIFTSWHIVAACFGYSTAWRKYWKHIQWHLPYNVSRIFN
jgi:hypothetical protein